MKTVILFILIVFSQNLYAQNYKNDGESYDFYCQIYGQLQTSGQILFKELYGKTMAVRQN